MRSRGLYEATITFTLSIEADNKVVAADLARAAIPKHFNSSIIGRVGGGVAKFATHEKTIIKAVR